MTLKELVKRKIDDLAKPIESALLGGSPTTLHDYHRLVGKYEGLQMAYREIEGVLDHELDD